jgi:methyl-accepting chemotaxis protein
MRSLSITNKTTLAAIAVLLLCATSSGAGLWATLTLSGGLERSMISTAIMRNHMNADMMHDAIRADAYTAILAADPSTGLTYEEAMKDFEEHRNAFERSIEANQGIADASTRAMFAKIKDAFSHYVAGAREIIQLTKTDVGAAKEKLETFGDLFKQLETAQEQISEAISAAAEDDGAKSTRNASFAGYFMGAMLALAIFFALALMVLTPAAQTISRTAPRRRLQVSSKWSPP